MNKVCNENCNECPLINHPNSRMITKICNELYNKFGEDAYKIIADNCPNFTVCYDCRVDDFSHIEGCKLISE